MTGPSVTYYTNPRFVPDDIRLRFGGSDDAALVYDATNDELTIQTTNLAGTLTDRVRFQANLDSPAVDMTGMRVNNLLAGLDDGSAASPALAFDADTDSGIYRIGADIVGVAVNGAEVARFAAAGERLGDSIKSLYGSGDDAAVYYDGSDLIIDPAEVGSGNAKIRDNTGAAFTRSIFIPASVFASWIGSPSLTTVGSSTEPDADRGTGQMPAWLLDAASNEAVGATITIPRDWDHAGTVTAHIMLGFASTNTAAAKYYLGMARVAEDDDLTADVAAAGRRVWNDRVYSGPGAANQLEIDSAASSDGSATFSGGEIVRVYFFREADDANDLFTGDLQFFGIEIEYDALR